MKCGCRDGACPVSACSAQNAGWINAGWIEDAVWRLQTEVVGARRGKPRLYITFRRLHSQLFHFFVVILAVEDRPFLGALNDGAPLAFDFLAGGLVDARFRHEECFENFAHFEADGVSVFDELDIIHVGDGVGHNMGEFIDFVAA
jgi:hypothetical protein